MSLSNDTPDTTHGYTPNPTVAQYEALAEQVAKACARDPELARKYPEIAQAFAHYLRMPYHEKIALVNQADVVAGDAS